MTKLQIPWYGKDKDETNPVEKRRKIARYTYLHIYCCRDGWIVIISLCTAD